MKTKWYRREKDNCHLIKDQMIVIDAKCNLLVDIVIGWDDCSYA